MSLSVGRRKRQLLCYYLDMTMHARTLVSYMYIANEEITYSLSVGRRKRQLRDIIGSARWSRDERHSDYRDNCLTHPHQNGKNKEISG